MMYTTIVHVYVKPDSIDDFIEATWRNHQASIEEPLNCRFDVLQDAADPAKFVLYEAYATQEGAAAHKETAHYLEWRKTVADMMAKDREGIAHNGLFPLS